MNDLLLTGIIIVNSYIITAPVVPKIQYWWQRNHSNAYQLLQKKIQASTTTPSTTVKQTPSQPNELIAPDMLLDTPILEGTVANTYKTLDQGIWHWPLASTPDKGGNTVLIGHRFTYTNPRGIFYNMDKVKVGDEIGLRWLNILYHYKVTTISVVPPSDTSILASSTDSRLTMYTCTPTWNPKDRLVVVAELEMAS